MPDRRGQRTCVGSALRAQSQRERRDRLRRRRAHHLWAKLATPASVYYDITWTATAGCGSGCRAQHFRYRARSPRRGGPVRHRSRAQAGRCTASRLTTRRAATLRARFGDYFFHRTGHSIGQEVHGSGANMITSRRTTSAGSSPGPAFPSSGIYLPEFASAPK